MWRVVREGRDPIQGAASLSRWCDGRFDVLYTSLERDGAIAKIHALLSAQPVFPSRIRSFVHKVEVTMRQALRVEDVRDLAPMGIVPARYRDRDYARTQAIADAAYFLGFDGLIVPSARWPCLNAVLFTDRLPPSAIAPAEGEPDEIDWRAWRRQHRGPGPTV